MDLQEAFSQAKSQSDYYTGTGSPFDAVLAEWTTCDKVDFACRYRNVQKALRTESVRYQMAQSAMLPGRYMSLFDVDFRLTASIPPLYHPQKTDFATMNHIPARIHSTGHRSMALLLHSDGSVHLNVMKLILMDRIQGPWESDDSAGSPNQAVPFRCSDKFVRTYLRSQMNWSPRKATQAAKKIPENREEISEKTYYRIVHLIIRYKIPVSLLINMDQTGIILIPGADSTFETKGA
ncbi:hypothetical protein MMC07_003991 [Pseudocyphellaria aurata]|nr:hypothetical protein [Pseudocyphellaria aurata]